MVTATEPKLITYDEAIARLGCSQRTLYTRIKDGHLTVYVSSANLRRRMLDERDVEKLIEARPRPERVA